MHLNGFVLIDTFEELVQDVNIQQMIGHSVNPNEPTWCPRILRGAVVETQSTMQECNQQRETKIKSHADSDESCIHMEKNNNINNEQQWHYTKI